MGKGDAPGQAKKKPKMATKTTTQAGPISAASTFGGVAFVSGDNIVAAHALTIDAVTVAGSSALGANPTAAVLGKTTGGSLAALTYIIRYTQVDAGGLESDLSLASASLLTDATNNRLTITLPALASGVSSYNIYALTSGQAYFRQIVGAGAGLTNLDTFSSATAYAPVPAIKVNNANGRLVINANLTIKGSLHLEGTTTVTDVIVTQAAGTTVEFDGSAAANTTFGYQILCGGFTSNRQSLYWKSNGTANSRCAIRSNASGANAFLTGFTSNTGTVDLNFTDLTRIGSATIDAFTIANASTLGTVNFTNCVFDTCGRIFSNSAMAVGFTYTVVNTTWKNTLHATENLRQGGATASPTAARTWVGNVADKLVLLATNGLVIGGTNAADATIFFEMPQASAATKTPSAITNTFFRKTTVAGGSFRLGDWLDCVMIVDGNTLSGTGTYSAKADLANPHWVSPVGGTTGTYLVTSCIFESFGADDQGDVDYSPGTSNSEFTYCIGVPEDTDTPGLHRSPGTLTTNNAATAGSANKYNHCTWFNGAQGAIALVELGTGIAGAIDELQSNIFWNDDKGVEGSTTFNRITYEPTHIASLSSGGVVANMVNATKCGHNCRYRLFTGSGTDALLGAWTDGGYLGHSYHHYATTGTFGTTDVTANPGFADSSVRFWTWVKSLAGATLPGIASPDRKDYQAWGLYKLSLKNEPAHADYDSRYTVGAYKSFIRAGFTPSNTLLRSAAHDGTDIGAMPVVSSGHAGGGGRIYSRRKRNMVGRTIKIQFSSADASTAAAVSLFDDNDAAVTLGANERLIIDTIDANVAAAVTLLTLFSDDDANAAVGAGERIAAFGANSGFFQGGEEGYALPIGKTPKVKASGAGQVDITGSGRIVIGTGGTVRPTWKQAEHA